MSALRRMALFVACALAACAVPDGTYLVVDGAEAGITFDKVEFFLGTDAGGTDRRLQTPGRPYDPQLSTLDAERHRMIKRRFTDSDVQDTSPTRSLTYLLTTAAPNGGADYGLIVASRGGIVVGVGEIENLNVQDDAAYIYEVSLAAPDAGFEVWGEETTAGASCARWTRPREDRERESTYAVVRGDDFDCDDAARDTECDDLNYCNPAVASPISCVARPVACIDSSGCDIGSCADGQGAAFCMPETCLPEQFCSTSDSCDAAGPLAEFLECALTLSASHIEVVLFVKTPGGPLCSHAFPVSTPVGLQCIEPKVEAVEGAVGMWTFSAVPGPITGVCVFGLENPSIDAAPPADAHLVVSVGNPTAMTPRTSFVIGFRPRAEAGCTPTFRVDPPVGAPNPICF